MARPVWLFGLGFIITCAVFYTLIYVNSGYGHPRVLPGIATEGLPERYLWSMWNENRTLAANLRIPANPPDFKPVSDLGSLLYVYAAIWQGEHIRITAVKSLGLLTNIACVVWYSSDLHGNFTTVKAFVKDLDVHEGISDCAYIKCSLPKKSKKEGAPVHVGLFNEDEPSSGPRIILPVENRNMDPKRVHQKPVVRSGKVRSKRPEKNRVVEFTVCVPAMFNYSNAAQLVEKLEMVRFFGAGRVVLYDHSIGANVRSVLEFYQREWRSGRDTLEVIVRSWKLPSSNVHYKAQVAAIDDCLYRYGWLSKYMVFNDLDEFIVPLRHENWSELIAEREKLSPGSAAFMFLSSVMNKDHSSPAQGFEADAFRFESSILGFTQRDDFYYMPVGKSKLIVNPRRVESLDVHKVYEAYGPTDVIPVVDGSVFHYRWPLRDCRSEVRENRVADKYGKRLVVRLKSVWSRLKGVGFGWQHPTPGGVRVTCKHSIMPIISKVWQPILCLLVLIVIIALLVLLGH